MTPLSMLLMVGGAAMSAAGGFMAVTARPRPVAGGVPVPPPTFPAQGGLLNVTPTPPPAPALPPATLAPVIEAPPPAPPTPPPVAEAPVIVVESAPAAEPAPTSSQPEPAGASAPMVPAEAAPLIPPPPVIPPAMAIPPVGAVPESSPPPAPAAEIPAAPPPVVEAVPPPPVAVEPVAPATTSAPEPPAGLDPAQRFAAALQVLGVGAEQAASMFAQAADLTHVHPDLPAEAALAARCLNIIDYEDPGLLAQEPARAQMDLFLRGLLGPGSLMIWPNPGDPVAGCEVVGGSGAAVSGVVTPGFAYTSAAGPVTVAPVVRAD